MLCYLGTWRNILPIYNESLRQFVGDYTGRRDDMFDGVVVDTGKVETVLAAAARQGHCVLLLDTAKYYSSGYRD